MFLLLRFLPTKASLKNIYIIIAARSIITFELDGGVEHVTDGVTLVFCVVMDQPKQNETHRGYDISLGCGFCIIMGRHWDLKTFHTGTPIHRCERFGCGRGLMLYLQTVNFTSGMWNFS